MALSENDKKILFKGCFYPEYNTIINSTIKPIFDAAKEFSTVEENTRVEKCIADGATEEGLYKLFETIYLPHFEATSAANQKLVLASAKQRIAVAEIADKVYEDFLDVYFPENKGSISLN